MINNTDNIRQILEERSQTQELLAWLRNCLINPTVKIRTTTWMGIAVQRRVDIVLEEYPELLRPESFEHTLILLEQYYLALEQQVVHRLPMLEQLYYIVIVPNWRIIVSLMLKCGATVISRKHDILSEYIVTQVYIDRKISVTQFTEQLAQEWYFCNWHDCGTLFEIKH